MVQTRAEDGVALVAALMMMALLGALATSLTLAMVAETRIAAIYRDGVDARHAAEVAAAVAVEDLAGKPDWDDVLAGHTVSAFTDGEPTGLRSTPGGPLDLSVTTNVVRCGRASACTEANLSVATAERPWGSNNPRWRMYAYGRLRDLLPVESDVYVIVWVGDDPAECDGTPEVDGGPCTDGVNSGANVVAMLAHAYAAAGVAQQIELTVGRAERGSRPRVLSWRHVR